MIYPILIYPRLPLKTKVSVPETHEAKLEYIKDNREQLKALIDSMYETMDAIDFGVGLSANQINNPDDAVCVLDPMKSDRHVGEPIEKFYMIFPEIVFRGTIVKVNEGCLSLPGYYGDIDRAMEVNATYYTLESPETGMATDIVAQGFLAQIIQHEVDHLNGVCFIDHMGPMRQQMAVKKMSKTRKRIKDFQWTPGKK